jgi:hypothetical protein
LGSCEPPTIREENEADQETPIQSFSSGTSLAPRDYKKVLFCLLIFFSFFFFFLSNDSLLVTFCSIRYILDIENQFGGQDDGVNCINKILDPNKAELTSMFKKYWPAIFLLLRVIVVLFVDSLFLYFPVVVIDNDENRKCLKFDIKLTVIALCFRTVFDMIYVGKIILGYIRRRHDREPRQKTTKMYLRLYFAALDILALLPIPQVRETFLLLNLFLFFFFFFQV